MLKIGEFSKLSLTTVKALRFYEKEGLLMPVSVDIEHTKVQHPSPICRIYLFCTANTHKNPQKCGFFLCFQGFSPFLQFADIASFLRIGYTVNTQ